MKKQPLFTSFLILLGWTAMVFLLGGLAGTYASASDTIWLSNVGQQATGTSLGSGHYGLDISGTINASNASVGTNGTTAPTSSSLSGGKDSGTGFLQPLNVDSTGKLNINNISGTVSLPTGAATEATLSTLNGKVTAVNTGAVVISSSALPTGAATEATLSSLNGKVTAVNTGAVVVSSSALPSGAATSAAQTTGNSSLSSIDGKITAVNTGAVVVSSSVLPTGAATSALQTSGNSSLTTIATNSAKVPLSVTGSGSAAAATVSTVITLTAPANAIGFILMNLDTSTANIRWAVGRTATTTLGQQLQPGRDTGFVPIGANVSIVAESGTQNYDIQWVAQ